MKTIKSVVSTKVNEVFRILKSGQGKRKSHHTTVEIHDSPFYDYKGLYVIVGNVSDIRLKDLSME